MQPFLGGQVAMTYAKLDAQTKEDVKNEYLKSIKPFKTKRGYEIPDEFVVCSSVKV